MRRLEVGDKLWGERCWGSDECIIVSVTDTEAFGDGGQVFNRDFTPGLAKNAKPRIGMDMDTYWHLDTNEN